MGAPKTKTSCGQDSIATTFGQLNPQLNPKEQDRINEIIPTLPKYEPPNIPTEFQVEM
jgi:hypothetical protein